MLAFVILSFACLAIAYIAEWKDSRVGMFICALLLALYSGLRGPSVGIDTVQYYFFYDQIVKGDPVFGVEESFLNFCDFLQNFSTDPALLIFFMSFITNILIIARLWTCRRMGTFWVMVAIYIAGYYPETMNVMRQFFAIALIFFGSYFLEKKSPLLFLPFLIFAIKMHTSSIVGVIFLFLYFWNKDGEKKLTKKIILLSLIVPTIYIGSSKIKDAYEIYSRYFETVKQNFGFMIIYKIFALSIITYVSKFGLVRYGSEIVGKVKLNGEIFALYLVGLVLCSLGMFFPYIDRIGLYFLMYEMLFWGWAIKANEMSIVYRIFCYIFVVYLFVMNLITDGHHIFPYVTIWGT